MGLKYGIKREWEIIEPYIKQTQTLSACLKKLTF